MCEGWNCATCLSFIRTLSKIMHEMGSFQRATPQNCYQGEPRFRNNAQFTECFRIHFQQQVKPLCSKLLCCFYCQSVWFERLLGNGWR